MLDPLPVPAYLWDIKTERFIGWNPQFRELLGYTDEEIRALDWRDLLVPDEVEVAQRAIQGGAVMSRVRWHFLTKAGNVLGVTISTRRTFFVDDDKELRDVYVTLVLEVGTSVAVPASDVF